MTAARAGIHSRSHTAALELAGLIPCTVYDALYIALALRDDALLISADRQLVAACAQHGLGEHVATVTEGVERLARLLA